MNGNIIELGLSWLTLISQIGIGLLIIYLLLRKVKKVGIIERILKFLRNNWIILALIVAIVATAGSLYFSEVMGFTPCKLCWYQRIFIYPIVIILIIGIWKKIKETRYVIIPMVIIGVIISAFQNIEILKRTTTTAQFCSLTGPSCTTDFFTHLGYINIPMMALTAFVLILVLSMIGKEV